jgi:hypothetical protein
LRDEASGRDSIDERGVTALVLVGVALGEVSDRIVEPVAGPRYAAIATRSPDRA